MRDTYQRAPEDVVRREDVQLGPPLRSLRAASRFETIRGQISCSLSQAAAFEIWRKEELRYQREPITLPLYDHVALRNVTVRMTARPEVVAKNKSTRRIQLEFRSDPVAPTPAALSALAALHKAGPAAWPVGVPGCPRVEGYRSQTQTRTAFADERNSPGASSVTNQEGAIETVTLPMSSTELEAFEAWFEADAALGARDIEFPVPGGTHLGCFESSYTVSGSNETSDWIVSFERYLEARP
ncbi:MAG: hypothetical protein AAFW60_01555 [Pseudomonadota bacterium]